MGVPHTNIFPGGRSRSPLVKAEIALLACERRSYSRGQSELCSAVYELLLLAKSRTPRNLGGDKKPVWKKREVN